MKSENLGAFYKYINKRTSYRPAIGALTDDGGNIKTDDHDKAELFSSYFSTVGVVDNGKIPVGQSLCSFCASSIETIEFDKRSIASAIGKLQWRRNVSQWDGSSRPTFKSWTARNAFCRPTFWPQTAYCTYD